MDAGFEEPLTGSIFVYWFGDGRISTVSLKNVKPFASVFGEVYSLQSADMGPKWKAGVLQAIQLYSNLDSNISFEDALEIAFTTYRNPTHEIRTFVPHSVSVELSKRLQRRWNHINTPKNTAIIIEYIREERDLSEICLGCYKKSACYAHPIFVGNLCEVCRDKLYHTLFAVQDERYCYCPICGNNLRMIRCSNRGCKHSFCGDCIENFSIFKSKYWACVICAPEQTRLIQARDNYDLEVVKFLAPEARIGSIPSIDCTRYDILVLFHGVSKAIEVVWPSDEFLPFINNTNLLGFEQLKKAHFQYMTAHFVKARSRSVEKMHQHNVNLNTVSQYNKLELLVGGSSHPSLNSERNDTDFQQKLFWEYFRIFQVMSAEAKLDFKFVFELNPTVSKQLIDIITRHLKYSPIIIKLSKQEYRLVWTNIEHTNPLHQLLTFFGS